MKENPDTGQQFEYAYDDIGNRLLAREGGDQNGRGFFGKDFGRTFLLTLFCDKQDMFSFIWSYHVRYERTKKSATVTLDLPF